ncbi:TetR/AcrR family transcriptional regulator [Brachybacterium sp. YJGR34]|uniref:TetR/AcrR family transcriptional regulator n=1 Tax=Brachybacterium sp. YJGR34 TaxID=2059911 RepID=UPI000E0C9752|nr:TetR/AcrR family transcriptional regulator [Brachybacterium sp. YJGR34]
MALDIPDGLHGAGAGPSPLSTVFSDRAGDESFEPPMESPSGKTMVRALRSLDALSLSEAESGVPGRAAAEVDSFLDGAEAAVAKPRREEILDGASELFAERGYHGASLRDISRRVGISHPGMLHHFASKQALLAAVVDRLEAHAQGLLQSVDSLTSAPRLTAALAGPWDPREHSMALLATLSAEVVNPDHPGRYRIARLRLVHEHVLEQALSGIGETGGLVTGVDAAHAARSLFSLLLSVTVREHTVRELQSCRSADPVDDVRDFLRLCLVD